MHGGGRSFAASGGKVRTCERPRGSPGAALFTVSRKDKVRKASWRSHRGLSWPLLRLLGGQWGGEAVGSREAVALAVSPALSAPLCCSFSLSLPLALSVSVSCLPLSSPPFHSLPSSHIFSYLFLSFFSFPFYLSALLDPLLISLLSVLPSFFPLFSLTPRLSSFPPPPSQSLVRSISISFSLSHTNRHITYVCSTKRYNKP